MPLYLAETTEGKRLVYAKTQRGAQNHVLEALIRDLRMGIAVRPVTPLEGAMLASQGIMVETVNKGEDVVMDDDPAEAKRGFVAAGQTSGDPEVKTVTVSNEVQTDVPVNLHERSGYVDDSAVMDPRYSAAASDRPYPVAHDRINEHLHDDIPEGEENPIFANR